VQELAPYLELQSSNPEFSLPSPEQWPLPPGGWPVTFRGTSLGTQTSTMTFFVQQANVFCAPVTFLATANVTSD
jgi:hypothetical protein